jgi:acyl-coenzyme A thioesterase PaaI-like protein
VKNKSHSFLVQEERMSDFYLTRFAQLLGIRHLGMEGNWFVAQLTPTVEHENGMKTVHGGLLTAIMDDTAGTLMYSDVGKPVAFTTSMSTEFIVKAVVGEVLTVKARIIVTDKIANEAVVTVEVSQWGKVVARSDSRWRHVTPVHLRKKKKVALSAE